MASVLYGFSRISGGLPARRLRVGSMDEPHTYLRHLYRSVFSGRWDDDAGISYHEGLNDLPCPVLHVLSEGDHWICDPTSARRFLSVLGSRRIELLVGSNALSAELRGLEPDHMAITTHPSSQPIWEAILEWIQAN